MPTVPTSAQQLLQHWDWQSDSPDGWHQISAEDEALAAHLDYILSTRPPFYFGTPPSSHAHQAGHSSSSGAHGCASASHSGGDAGASSSSSSRFGDPGASSSKAAAARAVQCGICFDMHSASSMVSAYQPLDAACCSSGATARCGHLYCADCMRGYVQDKVQVSSNNCTCWVMRCLKGAPAWRVEQKWLPPQQLSVLSMTNCWLVCCDLCSCAAAALRSLASTPSPAQTLSATWSWVLTTSKHCWHETPTSFRGV